MKSEPGAPTVWESPDRRPLPESNRPPHLNRSLHQSPNNCLSLEDTVLTRNPEKIKEKKTTNPNHAMVQLRVNPSLRRRGPRPKLLGAEALGILNPKAKARNPKRPIPRLLPRTPKPKNRTVPFRTHQSRALLHPSNQPCNEPYRAAHENRCTLPPPSPTPKRKRPLLEIL